MLKGDDAYNATLTALSVGYRHIDTAALYRNEADIGRAIITSKIPRKELFLTTKVLTKDQYKGPKAILKTFEASLRNLQTDYVDLLLLHGPCTEVIEQSWTVLEDLYLAKKCLMIGVSNFSICDLQLMKNTRVYPMVNQIELSPFFRREKLVQYCIENKIIIEAHSSLTRGNKLGDPLITNIAKKNNISTAQVLIKWALQNNYIVLPRSQNPLHIKENISMQHIKLSMEDMAILNNLEDKFILFPKFEKI